LAGEWFVTLRRTALPASRILERGIFLPAAAGATDPNPKDVGVIRWQTGHLFHFVFRRFWAGDGGGDSDEAPVLK
jgi:hypothetical protein